MKGADLTGLERKVSACLEIRSGTGKLSPAFPLQYLKSDLQKPLLPTAPPSACSMFGFSEPVGRPVVMMDFAMWIESGNLKVKASVSNYQSPEPSSPPEMDFSPSTVERFESHVLLVKYLHSELIHAAWLRASARVNAAGQYVTMAFVL